MSKEYTPLVIAKSFTKQYYEIIHSKPQQLYRFYKEESNFFHGEENESTETISGGDNIRAKVESLNLAGAKVDLTGGSIDAQKSDNNAVFLVVTGNFTMPGKSSRPFVQSFLLVCQNGGKTGSQPSYYVRNSIFRLFGANVPATPPAPPALVTTSVFEKKETVVESEVEKEAAVEKQQVEVEEAAEVTSEEDDAPKAEDNVDASTVTSEPEYVNVSVSSEKETVAPSASVSSAPETHNEGSVDKQEEAAPKEVKEIVPEPVVVKEKVKPASWACLFAGGNAAPTSAPEAAPVQEAKVAKKAPVKKESDQNDRPSAAPGASAKASSPPLTLYLCQLPDNVQEAEVRALFEPFGAIKKIDIHGQKGFAFVDFAEASSVKNAMAVKGTPGAFVIRDVALQVEERQTKGSSGAARVAGNRGGRVTGGNNGGNRQGGRNGDKKQGENRGSNNNNRTRSNKSGGMAKPGAAAAK